MYLYSMEMSGVIYCPGFKILNGTIPTLCDWELHCLKGTNLPINPEPLKVKPVVPFNRRYKTAHFRLIASRKGQPYGAV